MEDDNNTASKLIEIKEILGILRRCTYGDEVYLIKEHGATLLLDYITNLQQENERLKQELNCKEYFSSTMPENTEFVILTKNNYDRQQKNIEFELIDYKSRIEKAVEYGNNCIELLKDQENYICESIDVVELLKMIHKNYIEFLNGRSDE